MIKMRAIIAQTAKMLLFGFSFLSLVSCGGGRSNSTPPRAPTISSIAVAPPTGTSSTVAAGGSLQIVATASYGDGSTKDVTTSATWASQNLAVATVSMSGMVTAVAAGQTTISAALSGVQGSTSVTVKVVTSISIAPQNLTIFITSKQQFDAVAAFSDGSVQDITNTAQWASSAPTIASVSSAGVVTGLAAGNTSISVASGPINSSASVTISSATLGVTIVDDFTDSHLMSYQPGDGSLVTYFGTRNNDGTAAKIDSARDTTPDGKFQEIIFDSQGRTSLINTSDGSQLGIDWSSPSNPILTAISADRTQVGAVALATGMPAPAVVSSSFNAKQSLRSTAQASTSSPSPSAVFVHVTSCNGTIAEDDALVYVTKIGSFGGDPVRALPLGGGSGTYQVFLPSGPTSSPLQQSEAALDLGIICNANAPTITPQECNQFPPPLNGGCLLGAGTLKAVCAAQSTINGAVAVINYLNSKSLSVNVNADVTLNGISAKNTLSNQPPAGPYPTFESNSFPCLQVDHVNVSPTSATINVGQSVPLTATAVDINSKIITSSAMKWTWSPSDNWVQVVPGVPVPNGIILLPGVAQVKGVNGTTAGQPAVVTASATTPGQNSKSANSQITVTSLNVTGLWTGSYTWDPTAPFSHSPVSFGLQIGQQNGTSLTGQICFSDPNCVGGPSRDSPVSGTLLGNVVTLSNLADSIRAGYFTIDATVSNTGSPSTMTGRICTTTNGSGCGNLSLTHQ